LMYSHLRTDSAGPYRRASLAVASFTMTAAPDRRLARRVSGLICQRALRMRRK
jgi:hypothetical protein